MLILFMYTNSPIFRHELSNYVNLYKKKEITAIVISNRRKYKHMF